MASTASGIEYPTASDFIAPLNAHLQTLAETTQDALHSRAPATSTTYTPTFTNLTLGNGTVSAKYVKDGAIIIDQIVITFGSTTAIMGAVTIAGLQASVSATPMIVGSVNLHDTGSAYYSGVARAASATSIEIHVQNASGTYTTLGSLSATIPHTWATGDQIIINTVRLAA